MPLHAVSELIGFKVSSDGTVSTWNLITQLKIIVNSEKVNY